MHNFDENEVLRDALSGLNDDVPAMPEGLHAAWMQKVEDEARDKRTEKTLNRKGITRFLSIAAALAFVVGGTMMTRDDVDKAIQDRHRYEAVVQENGAMVLRAATTAEYKADLNTLQAAGAQADAAAGAATTFTMKRSAPQEPAMEDAIVAEDAAMEFDTAPASNAAGMNAEAEKKIIRTARLTIYTQTYDQSAESLRALCLAEGGWIESSSESTNSRTNLRTGHLTLRIPQEALDGYLTGAGELGRITSRSETSTDVTASYQDTKTRLATQVALMERLQALITESGDLTDLLALEAQIADTQYQIDALTSALSHTDRQASYSTVTISLYEETAPAITDTTVSFGERISAALSVGWEAFTDFCQDMLVFVIAALPFIAIVAALAIVVHIIRKHRRNRK